MKRADRKKILAIKLADLGDLLITEPALRSLREGNQDAVIDVLTTPTAAPLVEIFDGGYRCLTFNKYDFDSGSVLLNPVAPAKLANIAITLRRARYDSVVIFHHLTTPRGALKFKALARAAAAPEIAGLDNGRGTFLTHRAVDLGFGIKHESEYMLDVARRLGGADINPAPRISEPGEANLPNRFNLPQRFAALFPTTGPFAPGRNWLPESFAAIAALLQAEGLQPVILGATDASEAAEHILGVTPSATDLTGRTSVRDLIGIVRASAVSVTGDSFPGHLARALDRPVVSIFGPSNHRAWKPYAATEMPGITPERAIVVRHDVPCSPCLYTGYRLGRRNGCPMRTCLHNVTPEDVMSAVRAVVGEVP